MWEEVQRFRSTFFHQLKPNFQRERKKFLFLETKLTYLTTRTGPRRASWEKLKTHSLIVADHHGRSPLLPPSRVLMPLEMAAKIGQISVCSN